MPFLLPNQQCQSTEGLKPAETKPKVNCFAMTVIVELDGLQQQQQQQHQKLKLEMYLKLKQHCTRVVDNCV